MKTRFSKTLLLLFVALASLTACKKDDPATPSAASQTELLVANNWQTSRVTTVDGQTINRNRLNIATQILFELKMQFRADGRVSALDPNQSNQIINGGTWKLAADNQSIDVDVTGFKGNFPIVQLSRSRLILRQNAPVDGKATDINLEFDPVL
ncbi:hypothetical protein [Spirosoma montaniterrae]|uniref:Lipocalin-like domain-containing protein n=1 Tax=Spirosoma montaniterrae TaxID=1178516 RepID=A0A1P9WUM4_9BACT|nr:hypothetical protein [Spirosoma montaniterrae]AQG79085.1 hypothetical protein AWR27_06965 [Spirosoma montaniterrae]